MTARIPAHVREQQINNLQNITFVRWDGEYRNAHSRAIVHCDVDGFEWSPTVSDLLLGHKGCPQCAGNRRWTASERVEQINNLPNITFVRWCGEYRGSKSRVSCVCDKGHEWSASAHSLLNNKSGCPQCAKYGYDRTRQGTLYALRSECGTMVKIGISNNHVVRHSQLTRATPFAFNCIELYHGDGVMIATLEKVLHGLMEPVTFTEAFAGSTEWRKWDARLPEWFDLHRHWS